MRRLEQLGIVIISLLSLNIVLMTFAVLAFMSVHYPLFNLVKR